MPVRVVTTSGVATVPPSASSAAWTDISAARTLTGAMPERILWRSWDKRQFCAAAGVAAAAAGPGSGDGAGVAVREAVEHAPRHYRRRPARGGESVVTGRQRRRGP